jgi:hypothetical protein
MSNRNRNIFQEMLTVTEEYTNRKITELEQRLRRHQGKANQRPSWPLVITGTDEVLAEGRQVVLHRLEIAEGAVLTIKGTLRVLGTYKNRGSVIITNTGSFIRG